MKKIYKQPLTLVVEVEEKDCILLAGSPSTAEIDPNKREYNELSKRAILDWDE